MANSREAYSPVTRPRDDIKGTPATHMQFSDGIVEAIGNTPLIKLKRASAETGCTILGKAEFMNPGQSVKDRAGAADDPRGGDARRAQAGRSRGREHRRQYRHRARAGGQCARLPHADRDSRDAEPGEEGHAAALRRRAGRGACRALRQSEQLSAHRPAACR